MTRYFLAGFAAVILSFGYHPVASADAVSSPTNPPEKIIVTPKVDVLPIEPKKALDIGVDGYLFEGADFEPKTDFKVKVVYSPSLAAIRKERGDPYVVAYTFFPSDTNNNTCEIHIVDPRKLYWPEYIGHEFVHCLVGNFHRAQDVLGKVDPTK